MLDALRSLGLTPPLINERRRASPPTPPHLAHFEHPLNDDRELSGLSPLDSATCLRTNRERPRSTIARLGVDRVTMSRGVPFSGANSPYHATAHT